MVLLAFGIEPLWLSGVKVVFPSKVVGVNADLVVCRVVVAVVLIKVAPAMVVLATEVLVTKLFGVVSSVTVALSIASVDTVALLDTVALETVVSEGLVLVTIVVSVSREPFSVEMSTFVLYCSVEMAVARWFTAELLLSVVPSAVSVVIAWVTMAQAVYVRCIRCETEQRGVVSACLLR